MKLYNVAYLTLWRTPSEKYRICDIPPGSVLLPEDDVQNNFTKVTYRATRDFTGYVLTSLLDEISNPLPTDIVELPEQTYSLQDLKQYVNLFGNVQYNLCGQICAAMIVGDKLSGLLASWKIEKPTYWERVFPKNLSKPTGLPELVSVLSLYKNVKEVLHLWSLFFNWDVGRVIITPARLQAWLERGYKMIVNVKINHKGRLRPQGTPHWIVITRVEPIDVFGGIVTIYNPASNNIEQYSWDEFQASTGVPVGLLVLA